MSFVWSAAGRTERCVKLFGLFLLRFWNTKPPGQMDSGVDLMSTLGFQPEKKDDGVVNAVLSLFPASSRQYSQATTDLRASR